MMENTLSAADIAAVTRNDGWANSCGMGWGGGDSWVMIILFALIFGNGAFGGFGGRGGNPVTEADLCNANSFSELKGSVGRLSDQVDGVNINLTKGICDLGYTTLENFNALGRQLAECCCQNERMILENRYLASQNTAEINANTTAQTQKILDAICGNRMADMQNQINQLQLQAAMCGVVRYPNAATYTAGTPFWANGCGCNV